MAIKNKKITWAGHVMRRTRKHRGHDRWKTSWRDVLVYMPEQDGLHWHHWKGGGEYERLLHCSVLIKDDDVDCNWNHEGK